MYYGLALNPDKSDANAIWFSIRRRETSLLTVPSGNVTGTVVPLSGTLKILGILLDKRLSPGAHVAAYFHTRTLCHIRSLLSADMAKSVAVSAVRGHRRAADQSCSARSLVSTHRAYLLA